MKHQDVNEPKESQWKRFRAWLGTGTVFMIVYFGGAYFICNPNLMFLDTSCMEVTRGGVNFIMLRLTISGLITGITQIARNIYGRRNKANRGSKVTLRESPK